MLEAGGTVPNAQPAYAEAGKAKDTTAARAANDVVIASRRPTGWRMCTSSAGRAGTWRAGAWKPGLNAIAALARGTTNIVCESRHARHRERTAAVLHPLKAGQAQSPASPGRVLYARVGLIGADSSDKNEEG